MIRRGAAALLLIGCFHLAGCGSSPPPAADPPAEPKPRPRPAASAAEPRPAGTLYRDEVDAVVNAGLGRFLQLVDVEPSLQGGKFQGFRIVTLRPPEFWRSVDLSPGDVVTRVNGMPIERETEAYEAFLSLKKSDRLTVSYLRNGTQRELVYTIVNR